MSWLSDILDWLRRRRPLPPPVTPPPGDPAQAAALVAGINAERAKYALPPLAADARLAAAAQKHAAWMRSVGVLSHTGAGGSSFVDRDWAEGYPRPGSEVIAAGQQSAAEAVADWMDDPPHRAAVVGPYRAVGGGVSGGYWCVDFGY